MLADTSVSLVGLVLALGAIALVVFIVNHFR